MDHTVLFCFCTACLCAWQKVNASRSEFTACYSSEPPRQNSELDFYLVHHFFPKRNSL